MEKMQPTLDKIKSKASHIPFASILGFVLTVFGVIICAAVYPSVFPPLSLYFPDYSWGPFLFFLKLLLIVVSCVQFLSLLTSFFASKAYSTPKFCGAFIGACRRCSSNVTQTVVVCCSFLTLVLTVILFCFASMLRALEYGFSNNCETVPNTGSSSTVCVKLDIFGGANVHCGDDYSAFCDFWGSDVLINSLLAGASFLLLANFILIACAVANFMRYRHNIVDDIIAMAKKEKVADGEGLREEHAEDSAQPQS